MSITRYCFGLALALTLAAMPIMVGAQPTRDSSPQLAGSWLVTVSPDPATGVPPFTNVTSITRDGRMVNVHPGFGTSLGEWRRSGSGRYAVTFVGLIPQNNTILRTKVRASIDVDASGAGFSGPFQTDIFDAAGNLLQSFGGIVSAARFGVEPL